MIWDDFKTEVTATDKKKQAIKKLKGETRDMRRKLQEKKRVMNVMLWKASKVQESSTDRDDDEEDEEDREKREKIEAFTNYWYNTDDNN